MTLRTTTEGITMSVTEGHNRPVIDLWSALEPEALGAFLEDRFTPSRIRRDELIGAFKRFLKATAAGIKDDGLAAKATDFVRQIKASVKDIEETRTAIKAPVLAAQRQIDGMGRELAQPLVEASTEVERRVTVFMREKEAEIRRQAAEEAARKEAEAQALLDQAAESEEAMEAAEEAFVAAETAQTLAEAPAKELTHIRTQLGTTAGLRDHWVYDVEDITKVPAAYLQINDTVVKAAIRSGVRQINGLNIRNEPKASIR